MSTDKRKWQVVYETFHLPEAHIIFGKLEDNGIEAMIEDSMSNPLGALIQLRGRIRVFVDADALEVAKGVIENQIDSLTTADDAFNDWQDNDDE